MPQVRFIVETVSSAQDENGNRYRIAYITSAKTGKRLTLRDVGGESNVAHWLGAYMDVHYYPTIYSTGHTVTKKQYRALDAEAARYNAPYVLTVQQVEALEVEDPAV